MRYKAILGIFFFFAITRNKVKMRINKVSVVIYKVAISFLFYSEMDTAFHKGPYL